MRLVPFMPYALDANLGAAYNACMARLDADQWAIFVDHDCMPVTREWYRQFHEASLFVPDAGAIVAITNRIARPWQRAAEVDRENHDIGYHTDIGLKRLAVRTLLDITETKGFGGVMFALSKTAWRDAGGFADGLRCVDHSIHFRLQRTGRRSYLHEGLYVYHRRRAFIGPLPPGTPGAANCPCRGVAPLPTRRLTLPERTAA